MDIQTEQALRRAVIAEAWTWLGTPWRHRARIKGHAVDCAGLLAQVFVTAGVIEDFDAGPYARLWFLHHTEELFIDWIRRLGGHEIHAEDVKPADILVYKIGLCYAHGAILVDDQKVVHAFHKNRQVIATEVWDGSLSLPVRAFDMFASRRDG